LILTFGSISGAHFNPAVTLAEASQGGLAWGDVPSYVVVQVAGAFGGVAAAHVMFETPLFIASRHARAGPAQVFSEFVATFGRLATVDDAPAIARIHNEGIEERVATFETDPRSAVQVAAGLAEKGDRYPTIVGVRAGEVVAWASAGPYRNRPAYAGVAEHSVY